MINIATRLHYNSVESVVSATRVEKKSRVYPYFFLLYFGLREALLTFHLSPFTLLEYPIILQPGADLCPADYGAAYAVDKHYGAAYGRIINVVVSKDLWR